MFTRRDIWVLGFLGLLAVATALVQNTEARLQAAPAADPARAGAALAAHDLEIRTVILAQVMAFRQRDDAAAFAQTSPDIRARYTTPQSFRKMMKTHYRPVTSARHISFVGASFPDKNIKRTRQQLVYLVDERGRTVQARYHLQKQPDGNWRISGCRLTHTRLRDV